MKRPNILIFMTDQQRGDSIPPYSRALTPNLDKFCSEGVTFTKTFGPAPHCCPARATFFSGLFPTQHGVWNNVNVGNTLSLGLNSGVRLWSEDLADAGYYMLYNGKWHVSDEEGPDKRGFNTVDQLNKPDRYGTRNRHDAPDAYEWSRYHNIVVPEERTEGTMLRPGYGPMTLYGHEENEEWSRLLQHDRNVVDSSVEIIKNRKKSDTPWCHYIGTIGPHDPYTVPQKYLDMYDIEDIKLPPSYYDNLRDKPNLYRKTRDTFDQLTEDEHRESIRHYLAFCTYEDALFGEILDILEEKDEIDNTMIIYTSDHGDYLAEHGLWCKGLPCFQGAYHIPNVICWKGVLKNGGRYVDEFVGLQDFAPTFLEAAGIEPDREFAGNSLMPFIKDEQPDDWIKEVYTQSNGNELYGIQRSVMTKEWKYVYNGYDYDELYDLTNDPNETRNLIEKSRYEDTKKELMKKIWRFAHKNDDVCINPYIMVGLATYGPGIIFEENN